MATITGLTADRMLEIEAASIVDGDIVGDNLFLEKHDGTLINAGNVRGPAGPTGPVGSPLHVVTAQAVQDVGIINQIRAGRQLSAADFTNPGLSAPLGLWNLSNFNDASGNGRTLTNKGSVPIGVGINGLASTAAAFAGSSGQALYIDAAGGSANFNIKMGSWGCWFKSAKRGVYQYLLSKISQAAGNYSFALQITDANKMIAYCSLNGSALNGLIGQTDVVDDRWHHVVATFDGAFLRIFLDGNLETYVALAGLMFAGNGPLNIGGAGADSGATAIQPHYGRVDEAFVTSDVLNLDQIRYLYAASIPHALGSTPSAIGVSVRRKRRGGSVATTDFPSQPARLHNFTATVLTDQGANNIPLTWTAGAQAAVAGADGSKDSGYVVNATSHLQASDAGLPAGLVARSYGLWFKTSANNAGLFGWGTVASADARLWLFSTGAIQASSGADAIAGPFVGDGEWHHAVVTEDNSAADGVKRKLYLDGKLVGGSTVMNSLTLAGANRLRIGANSDGTGPVASAMVDGVFIFAGVLTADQVYAVYNVGVQVLSPSPKNAGDHIEAVESARILAIFDTIEGCDQVDMGVLA